MDAMHKLTKYTNHTSIKLIQQNFQNLSLDFTQRKMNQVIECTDSTRMKYRIIASLSLWNILPSKINQAHAVSEALCSSL